MSLIKRLIWQIRKPIAKTLDSPTKKERVFLIFSLRDFSTPTDTYILTKQVLTLGGRIGLVPVVGMWGGGLIILLFQMFLPLPFVRQPSIPRLRDQIIAQWVFL